MKTYNVRVPVELSFMVEAEDKEAAIRQAWRDSADETSLSPLEEAIQNGVVAISFCVSKDDHAFKKAQAIEFHGVATERKNSVTTEPFNYF